MKRPIDATTLRAEFTGNFNGGYDTVAEIKALIDNAPTLDNDINFPTKWISVKDRMPDEYGKYLIRDKMDVTIALLIDKEKGLWQWSDSDFYGRGGITHWMPLPQLPEEDADE